MELALILFLAVVIFVLKSIKVVPQQQAYVVERLGRYHGTLQPGLSIVVPFVDRVAYKHILKEIPLDVPSQICITRDNTQLKVDGILYFQVTDPQRASYGSSDYILAITQLAQTTLRSVIGKMELDKTFEERDEINRAVVAALDEAAFSWGVKVLRYEIKDLVPPQDILHAMQAQITAEREKRALIASSEGRKMEQINIASGAREAAIQQSQGVMQATINQSEGEKQAAINKALGEAEALRLIATATAEAVKRVAEAIQTDGGIEAVNLKVAEQYVDAFSKLAKTNNTVILPSNVADIGGLVATAMSIVKQAPR
ncbi:MAG TPA: stomatin-like protein [Pseudogulbenkiania sp.]|nr:stomatin-like protein [Pseudogulbenkiania sp.]